MGNEGAEGTILIVDDDEHFASSLQYRLSKRGFDALTASRLADAQAIVRRVRVWTCILDIFLDGEWGPSLIDELHRASIRIVVLSGCLTVSLTARLLREMRVADVVTKPVELDRLVSAILGIAPAAGEIRPYKSRLDDLERELISQRLADCRGNVTRAARSLGIHRQSLQRKLRKRLPKLQ